MVIAFILFVALISSTQQDFADTQFINAVPRGVSTAFTKDQTLWLVKSPVVTIVKIGTGSRDIPFEKDGAYIKVFPGLDRKLFIQFSDGEVGEIDLPSR